MEEGLQEATIEASGNQNILVTNKIMHIITYQRRDQVTVRGKEDILMYSICEREDILKYSIYERIFSEKEK